MTSPYRLRDALRDRKSAWFLAGTMGSAVVLGLAPEVVEDYSLGPALMLAYVAVWTAILLTNMYTTDRRLREVSA
jgi:hypothetical protein